MIAETEGAPARTASPWTTRIIHEGRTGLSEPPAWLVRSHDAFHRTVTDPTFPCFFGTLAEAAGEMFYSFVSGRDLAHLPTTLARFAALSTALPNQRNNFAVFFEPDTQELDHDGFRRFCWSVLQYLHDRDDHPAAAGQPDPEDAAWEFCFAGMPMFVVGCSPTYGQRRSRNIGPGIVMLFQPRSVFLDVVTNRDIGVEARAAIRRRLLAWDGVAAHTDLGVYGKPDNREWKQYFLPDSDALETGTCPFRPRGTFQPVVADISRQAALRPEADAVSCEGERLSYGALEAWSNRIGRRLKRCGVGADVRVGLCVERAPGLVAALLGVLKAGGAFVPLDPAYPVGRLADMIADSGIDVVAADSASAETLAGVLAGRAVVIISDVEEEQAAGWDEAVHPDQLAYVMYTSGSTGRPKGVAISHQSLSLHMKDFLATYRITQADTVLQSSTINFDVALHELLPALMTGGRVEMRGPVMWDLATLTRRLAEEGVTFSRIPTAYWQQWLHALPDEMPMLRQITVGGEGLPGDALTQWRAGPLADIRLDNLYGPTETTIACLFHQTGADDGDDTIVSIGRPFPGRSACVMDNDGNEVPVGVRGELCIGGDTLARGYLNRPGLTAERFVPDPSRFGGRLYRTGDLCEKRLDGTFAFHGRLDRQVKLRGFRIEPGEIEAAMRRCPGVRESAAIFSGDGDQRKITGYVTGAVESHAVRQSLQRTLPGHMIPAAIVVLDTLPLMPNGKLDRAALPVPPPVAADPSPPATDIEQRLARLWKTLLRREDIGRSADFFELGGHSLLAVRLIALVKAEFGHRIGLAAFFKAPTLAGFARVIADTSAHDSDFSHIVRLYPANSSTPLFGINSTGAFYHLARLLGPELPVIGLQLFDPSRLPSRTPGSVEEIAAGYKDMIRALQPRGPYRLFGWSVGGVLAFEVAQQLSAEGAEVAFLGVLDGWAPGTGKRADPIRLGKMWRRLLSIPVIVTDLLRMRGRKTEFLTFLARHQTLARLLFPSRQAAVLAEAARNPQVQYDNWLSRYLTQMTRAYVPRVFPGRVHLFRATLEARPALSDASMGWQALTALPLRRIDVTSEHLSICRPPGVAQIAGAMAAAIE